MKKFIKLILILSVFLIVFYIVYQVYSFANPTYKTIIATEYTVDDSISCTGIAVRNESVIRIAGNGIVSYLVNEGEKVANGATIAEVYSTSTGAINKLMKETLSDEYKAYNDAALSTSSGNISSVQSQLGRKIIGVADAVSGDLEDLYTSRNELIKQYSVFLTVSGKQLNYDSMKSDLAEKLDAALAGTNPNSYVYSENTGYFCSSVDGFEDIISIDSLSEMTPEQIKTVIETPEAKNSSACKLISGYDWKFVAIVTAAEASRYTVGRSMPINFKYTPVDSLNFRVESIAYSEDGEYASIVFGCDRLNADILSLRVQEVDIRFKNYTGIKVDRSALRIEDGVLGVYVKYGSRILFRELNVIYETDEYVISKIENVDNGKLRLFDEIIIEGKDLYVGKEL